MSRTSRYLPDPAASLESGKRSRRYAGVPRSLISQRRARTAANIGGTAAGGPLASIASPGFGLLVSRIGPLQVATAAVLSSGRGRDKSDLKWDFRRGAQIQGARHFGD